MQKFLDSNIPGIRCSILLKKFTQGDKNDSSWKSLEKTLPAWSLSSAGNNSDNYECISATTKFAVLPKRNKINSLFDMI